MPAYPCSQCSTPTDVRDYTCRQCGTKTPFTCSKCSKALGAVDIFNAEQLSFQKPVYCERCGRDAQPLTCPNCKTDVYRSGGVDDDGVLYHSECYKSVAMRKKVAPVLRVVLMLFLGYATYAQVAYHTASMFAGLGTGLGAAAVGWWLGGLMAPPR